MKKKHPWRSVVMILLVLSAMQLSIGLKAQEIDTWFLIQNSAQGYKLSAPESAHATRYDPEGILHIDLDNEQTLLVRTIENSRGQSLAEWTDGWLAANLSPLDGQVGPGLKVSQRFTRSMQGVLAETVDSAGVAGSIRFTILAGGSHLYLLSYPLGDSGNESLFEQMVGSFEIGSVATDAGFEVYQTNPSQVITSLSVPCYSQKDSQWICDQLGTCTCNYNVCLTESFTTIGDAGCFITSQAMIWEYYSVPHFMNPQELDTCLTAQGAYYVTTVCTSGRCGAPYWPPSACRPSAVTYAGKSDPPDFSLLDSDLAVATQLLRTLTIGRITWS